MTRQLEIIGEASAKISKEFREHHAIIPWKKMIGLRNFLIHEYFGVNDKIIWETYEKHLPELKKIITPILKN